MYFVHYRSARTLSKQLRYNHHCVSLKTYHGEKSAVIMMGIVIGVFIITYGMYLHCSFLILFDTTGMASCNDAKYKIQPSEAFYVRACHIFASAKISPRRPNPDRGGILVARAYRKVLTVGIYSQYTWKKLISICLISGRMESLERDG